MQRLFFIISFRIRKYRKVLCQTDEKNDGKPVSTYVPFRNGLFYPAQQVLLYPGCGVIYYGALVMMRQESATGLLGGFNRAMGEAVYWRRQKQVTEAPFVNLLSAGCEEGLRLKVPYRRPGAVMRQGSSLRCLRRPVWTRPRAFEEKQDQRSRDDNRRYL